MAAFWTEITCEHDLLHIYFSEMPLISLFLLNFDPCLGGRECSVFLFSLPCTFSNDVEDLGLSNTEFGFIIATMGAARVCTNIPAAWAAEKYGRWLQEPAIALRRISLLPPSCSFSFSSEHHAFIIWFYTGRVPLLAGGPALTAIGVALTGSNYTRFTSLHRTLMNSPSSDCL